MGPSPDTIREQLCPQLQTLFDYEIAHGNRIDFVVTSWEKIDLEVVLEQPFFSEKPGSQIITQDSLSRFVNRDPHYPLQTSYLSEEWRQAISAPTISREEQERIDDEYRQKDFNDSLFVYPSFVLALIGILLPLYASMFFGNNDRSGYMRCVLLAEMFWLTHLTLSVILWKLKWLTGYVPCLMLFCVSLLSFWYFLHLVA